MDKLMNTEIPLWGCLIIFAVLAFGASILIESVKIRLQCGIWPKWSWLWKKNKK